MGADIDLLRRARARIADPARWCQGHEALDATMEQVAPNDPRAVYWCAVGALRAEFAMVDMEKFEADGSTELDALDEFAADYVEGHVTDSDLAEWVLSRPGLADINDQCSHAAVLAIYDAAIAAAEAAR